MILFVGDTSKDLASAAAKFDPTALLITEPSYYSGTCFTSLGDTSEPKFIKLLQLADSIFYVPFNNSLLKEKTELWLTYASKSKVVHNFIPLKADFNHYNLTDYRKTDDPQLWIAGCSFANGSKLDKPEEQRYGQLVANHIGKDVSHLSEGGSSISYQASQILRSNLQKDDILIWCLTSMGRAFYFQDKLHHIANWYYDENPEFESLYPINNLMNQNNQYRTTLKIKEVQNFAKLVGCQLLISQFYLNTAEDENYIFRYLFNQPEFFPMTYDPITYLDYGSDNKHPGVLQHAEFSAIILNEINKRGIQ